MSSKSTDSAAASKHTESTAAADSKTPEVVKKVKTAAKPDVYSKTAAPVSFFVTNPVQSAAAYCDDPGFMGPEGESDSSSEEEAGKPAVSLFPATSGLFSGSLFAPGPSNNPLFTGSMFNSKAEETKGEKSGLFVPLTQSTKRASLFDPPPPPPAKEADKPSSQSAAQKPTSESSPSTDRK